MDNLILRRNQILNLVNSQEYKDLNTHYSQTSFFNILNISRKESTHSDFLAWILNPKSTHNLLTFPLKKLLETIVIAISKSQRKDSENKFPRMLQDIIIGGNYDLDNVKVEREKDIGIGRLDLYVSFSLTYDEQERKLRIILENKVKSTEGDNQTNKYFEWAENTKEIHENIYVYLTPLSNVHFKQLKEVQCQCKKFIQLNYQYLTDYVLEPCLKQTLSAETEMYINNYLRTLSLPVYQLYEKEKDRGEIIMALGEQERNLLLNFWENHKDLLIATLSSLKENPDISEEDRHILDKGVSAIIKTSTRNLDKFKMDGVVYSKRGLALAIITKYVKEHQGISFEELEAVFPPHLRGGSLASFDTLENALQREGGYRNFIKPEELITLSDCTVAVSNQWGILNIHNLITVAHKEGYDISEA